MICSLNSLLNFEAGIIQTFCLTCSNKLRFFTTVHETPGTPIFHHQAEAIEAHLTIVFTALAIARQLQTTTGISIKRLIRTLRPLRQVTIQIAGQTITAQPHITPDTTAIIEKILGH